MKIRFAKIRRSLRRRVEFLSVSFLPLTVLLLAGCGAPGEPVAPVLPIPSTIGDLAARQTGDSVELTFTLPEKSVAGDRLTANPAVEILRGDSESSGQATHKSFRVVYAIPGSLVSGYLDGGHLRYIDNIAREEIQTRPGAAYSYVVRTRVSLKKTSANSNEVSVRVFPLPERIERVEAQVSESAIELNWAPPAVSAEKASFTVSGYRVYRGELEPSGVDPASQDLTQAKWIAKPRLVGSPGQNKYRDTAFDFGKTYVYVVRGVVTAGGNAVESADSLPAIVVARDTFPPAAPQDVVAAVLPGETPEAMVVELSWGISTETDFAGYRVYRSEHSGTRGELVNSELLPTPAIRDTSVQPAHYYWYTITAVDRTGNESAPSEAVAVDMAQLSP